MPKFTFLIYERESAWESLDAADFERILGAHAAFGERFDKQILGGEGLEPTKTARTVRGATVTDGPFVETKEALGGYYLVEADDLDAAVEIAKQVPHEFGYVEVRPVQVFGA